MNQIMTDDGTPRPEAQHQVCRFVNDIVKWTWFNPNLNPNPTLTLNLPYSYPNLSPNLSSTLILAQP